MVTLQRISIFFMFLVLYMNIECKGFRVKNSWFCHLAVMRTWVDYLNS